MKRLAYIAGIVWCVAIAAHAQSLSSQMGPVPAAICEEAPLPPEMAKAKAALEQEKKQKLIRQGSYLPNSDAKILTNVEKYVGPGAHECAIKSSGKTPVIRTPILSLKNSSHGRESIESGDVKFNIKKDRMSYAVLRNGNCITLVNHKNKACDMSDFAFETNSEVIRMNGNKIEIIVPTLNIAAGDYPAFHKVTCTHIPSGSRYIFDVHLDYRKQMNCGEAYDGAYTFDVLGSDSFPDLALMCDLKTNELEVVHLPFTFTSQGHNGSNGSRGRNGANGIDQLTYQDKEGKTHTIKGTCAKAGENGGDGDDGGNGGTFLICVSQLLLDQFGLEAISAHIEAGKGGKGGDGGKGGIHGKGSPCSGKAPDGARGRDGKDGKRGDFLYVVADVNGFYLSMFGK